AALDRGGRSAADTNPGPHPGSNRRADPTTDDGAHTAANTGRHHGARAVAGRGHPLRQARMPRPSTPVRIAAPKGSGDRPSDPGPDRRRRPMARPEARPLPDPSEPIELEPF